MDRTTGTTATNGFGCLVTAIGAGGFMGITSAVADGIGPTRGPVIGTIVITIAATTGVTTMIATTTGVGIAGGIAAGVAISRAARLPVAGDRDPHKG
ncbi:MAG TPA: hypothetical protein VNP98_18360 [Chthoniobacterales bacterium]|nr:hypothetical protein [Chthoniobacterales bacterium]